jgi:hypothetical protein
MARLGSVVGIAVAVVVAGALPASAAAEVVHPEVCGFGPDPDVEGSESIPGTGITDFIPATYCQIVFTENGANFVIRAELPEGYAVDQALVLKDEGSITVVTPSGAIVSKGSF